MIDVAIDVFGGMDFSSGAVWFVLGLLVFGGFITVGLIFLLMYKCKLIIPKSKLYDDAFVKDAQRNYHRFLIFWRLLFGLCSFSLALVMTLHFGGVWNAFETSRVWMLVLLCLTVVSMPFAIGVGRYTPSAGEVTRKVQRQRLLHELRKDETPAEKAKIRLLVVIFLVFYAAALALLVLMRGLGLFGLVLRLTLMVLGIIGALLALPAFWREYTSAASKKKVKAAGWCVAWAIWAAAAIWLAIPCVQDLVGGPATAQVEVISFTGRHLRVVDMETGERHSLRLGSLERYLTLKELWQSWKGSQPLYCTITYYPHTGFRIAVENITY